MCFRRVHPFTFTTIYTALSILSLTENGVYNAQIIMFAVAQAHVVSLLYLQVILVASRPPLSLVADLSPLFFVFQVIWYWVGYNEKQHHGIRVDATHAADLYTTKEMQYALFLALVSLSVIPLFLTMGPFDYNADDITLRIAPLVFLVLSVYGTLYIQGLKLDDQYGKDAVEPPTAVAGNAKELLVWHATRITGGKLAVSLLLLIFGFAYELNMVGDYFRDLRAYSDKIPDRAWQYDVASKYTVGSGFLPSSVNNLMYL